MPANSGGRAFDSAVERYAALRTAFEDPLPSFDDRRRDPWTLVLMRRYLASAIRKARLGAEEGCVFAPVAGLFRETISRAIYEIDIEGLIDDEFGAEPVLVDVLVNEPLPAWALSIVPASLLERLPPLPEAIEYRIVGGALILWDAHAEIVIDLLPNAFTGRWPS